MAFWSFSVPKQPKLGMDTAAGWFAYLMKNDLMFVKRFAVERDRPYNEVAGLTMSIWYPDRPMCELEPIGPRRTRSRISPPPLLKPGICCPTRFRALSRFPRRTSQQPLNETRDELF